MPIISAFTLIRAISLFHITAAFLFLTAPRTLADQNVVFMLGESMRLAHITSMNKPNEATGFIAVILALLGISDITAASMNEEIALHYWLSNVPVRMTFLFAVTGYAYLFKEDGLFGSGSMKRASLGEPVQNSLVFTFGFLEIAAWFWIFTNLRDQRRQFAQQKYEKMKAEEDRL